MEPGRLLAEMREESRLSLRALAQAASVATSTVHRIEKGELRPTVDLLQRLAEAAGMRIEFDARIDYAASLVGLGRSIATRLNDDDGPEPVRMAAELVHRFRNRDASSRTRMITAEPAPTGDARWDAFLGGLGEWLAVTEGVTTPRWTQTRRRFLGHGWWVTRMKSMHAWEYAGTPMSFKRRGVYIHRDSLENV